MERTRNDIFEYGDGSKNSFSDFIGVTHINPRYSFSDRDCVLEGAERIRTLGSRSIKFYLSPNYRKYYSHHIDWEDYSSPTALAKSPTFSALLDMDFHTFFIGAYIFEEEKYATYWKDTLSSTQKEQEYREIYDLTYYLCTHYQNSGKTFILQNWESDWGSMEEPDPANNPEDAIFDRLTEWTNIRQDAVNQAREDAKTENVRVYHALEVNLIAKALAGGKTVSNQVIHRTYCDYYSYSAYDTEQDAELFAKALDHLRACAENSQKPGGSRIFVGEFGLPENEFGAPELERMIRTVTEVSREKQVDYILFWQLYDNEAAQSSESTEETQGDCCRGYWLIRPDGTKAITWDYFYGLINSCEEAK